MSSVLDLSGKDSQTALEAIESRLEALGGGEAFEARVTEQGEAVLAALQERAWGRFEWAPLEGEGATAGEGCLIWIQKRPAPLERRAIGEFLTGDHRRCDDLFTQLEQSASEGDLARTLTLFAWFEKGMGHHFAMEEEAFFPAFEERTGMRQGPTMVMRMEHEQMRGVLRQMRQSLDAKEPTGVARACTTLLMLMQQHNVKEEQMLYAMADQQLADQGDELVRRMQRLP